jgi:hypothetical protein
MDGEAIIVKECFEDDVQSSASQALIDLGKVTKSDTGNHQASDRAPTFRDVKKGLETVESDPSIVFEDPQLQRVMHQLIVEFNNTRESDSKRISSKNAKKIITSCQRVSYVVCNYMNMSKVRKGYDLTGQHVPLDTVIEPERSSTVHYSKIMAQSYCDLDADTISHMLAVSPQLIAKFRITGKVTDADMDALHVPRMIGDTVEHSNEVYWKGLARLLTAEDTVAKFKDYVQEQKDKKDPEKIAEKKQTIAAAKALQVQENMIKKKEAADAKKAATKEASRLEKNRRNSLTPAQRKEETRQKAEAKKQAEAKLRAESIAHLASVGVSVEDALSMNLGSKRSNKKKVNENEMMMDVVNSDDDEEEGEDDESVDDL